MAMDKVKGMDSGLEGLLVANCDTIDCVLWHLTAISINVQCSTTAQPWQQLQKEEQPVDSDLSAGGVSCTQEC